MMQIEQTVCNTMSGEKLRVRHCEYQDTCILAGCRGCRIHILQDPTIVSDVLWSDSPATVQGITGDRVKVTMESSITDQHDRKYNQLPLTQSDTCNSV